MQIPREVAESIAAYAANTLAVLSYIEPQQEAEVARLLEGGIQLSAMRHPAPTRLDLEHAPTIRKDERP